MQIAIRPDTYSIVSHMSISPQCLLFLNVSKWRQSTSPEVSLFSLETIAKAATTWLCHFETWELFPRRNVLNFLCHFSAVLLSSRMSFSSIKPCLVVALCFCRVASPVIIGQLNRHVVLMVKPQIP